MRITLDEKTLRQAVTNHLHNVGVASDIVEVVFRYTRVPYTVFAEVELSEAKAHTPRRTSSSEMDKEWGEKDSAVCVTTPMLDPSTVPPAEEVAAEEPKPDSPAAPLFGGE